MILNMNMTWVWIIVVGILAGIFAGKNKRGKWYGLIANLLLGVTGALVGGWSFTQFDFAASGGFAAQLLMAMDGALVLVFTVRLLKKE